MNIVIDGNAFLNVSASIVKNMLHNDKRIGEKYFVSDLLDDSKFVLTDYTWNTKYPYKKYSRVTTDNGQRTYDVEGKKIPSVTTILSATKPKESQEALQRWRDRVGNDEAKRITNDAALRGTEMHYVIEQYMNGIGYLNLNPSGELSRKMAHMILT
jgi:hypothetical protein